MVITQSDFVTGSVIFVVLLLGFVIKTAWFGSSEPNDDADVEALTGTKARLVIMARESNKKVIACLRQGLSLECGQARRSRIRLMKDARRVDSIIRNIRAEQPFPKTKIDA